MVLTTGPTLEYLRAFSFASRSLTELREFLRASYEAGSFRKISDIAAAIEDLEGNIEGLADQEQYLRQAMASYALELNSYKEWAQAQQ